MLLRANLLYHMVNICPLATKYKFSFDFDGSYFNHYASGVIKHVIADINDIEQTDSLTSLAINSRKSRQRIVGFINTDGTDKYKGWGQKFVAGDIMRLNVERGPYAHLLEGLCLGIKKRGFLNKDTSILIRNVLFGVGVEITASYYNNRLYKCGFNDYKRKQFEYLNHKLYYLRHRDNRETQV